MRLKPRIYTFKLWKTLGYPSSRVRYVVRCKIGDLKNIPHYKVRKISSRLIELHEKNGTVIQAVLSPTNKKQFRKKNKRKNKTKKNKQNCTEICLALEAKHRNAKNRMTKSKPILGRKSPSYGMSGENVPFITKDHSIKGE